MDKKYILKQRERIKSNTEIRELKNTGKKLFGKYYYIIYKPNGLENNRIAALVGKKNRNAVTRNYERRLIREIYRQNKEILYKKVDLLIIKNKDGNASFEQKQNDLKNLFKRC